MFFRFWILDFGFWIGRLTTETPGNWVSNLQDWRKGVSKRSYSGSKPKRWQKSANPKSKIQN
jgi:hypothetical protein